MSTSKVDEENLMYAGLRKILDDYKDYPLSGEEVHNILQGKANVLLYTDLPNYQSIDEVLAPSGNAVILYEAQPGIGHWCALMKSIDPKDGAAELLFFDPYGEFVDTQVDQIPEPFRTTSGQSEKYLSQLLLECDYPLNFNEFQFQKLDKRVKSCGRWCCLMIIMNHYGMDLYTFKKFFLNVYSDDIATILTS